MGALFFSHPAPIKLLYISGLRLEGAEGAGFFALFPMDSKLRIAIKALSSQGEGQGWGLVVSLPEVMVNDTPEA